jgi:hypothetical protein
LIRWCVSCGLPEHLWDPTDPLHTEGSPDCPDCIRVQLDDDAKHKRQES